jgi:tRNA A37 N6-isopentenylltransferase MiaA
MLNYILEMVTKSKRVLFVLQQKDIHLRRLIETNDLEWRRRHTELLTQTDDRIAEIRRKTGKGKSFARNLIFSFFLSPEETVLEIKRQSIIDLQKAISQTEQKSNEILVREREQYQRIKAQTFEEAYALLNRQEDGPEVRTNSMKFP